MWPSEYLGGSSLCGPLSSSLKQTSAFYSPPKDWSLYLRPLLFWSGAPAACRFAQGQTTLPAGKNWPVSFPLPPPLPSASFLLQPWATLTKPNSTRPLDLYRSHSPSLAASHPQLLCSSSLSSPNRPLLTRPTLSRKPSDASNYSFTSPQPDLTSRSSLYQ